MRKVVENNDVNLLKVENMDEYKVYGYLNQDYRPGFITKFDSPTDNYYTEKLFKDISSGPEHRFPRNYKLEDIFNSMKSRVGHTLYAFESPLELLMWASEYL